MPLREKIDLLKRRQAQGKVESPTGFLLSAIKHNYPHPDFVRVAKKQRQAVQDRAEAERQAALEQRFEAHREQVFWQRFVEQPEAWQAEQRQRFEAMIQAIRCTALCGSHTASTARSRRLWWPGCSCRCLQASC